jgi:tetratricopeptide (TPR) repeat protein
LRTYEGLAWLMMQTDQERMLYAMLRVLNLSERTQWRESKVKALGAVGFAFDVLGMHKLASSYHQRSTIILKEGSDLGAEALLADLYAAHHLYIGNWDCALDNFRRAKDLAYRIGDLDTWTSACGLECILLCERGDLPQVRALCEDLLRVARETGYSLAQRWGLLFRGAFLRRAGRLEEAETSLRQALEAAVACGDALTQVDAYGELGVLAIRTKRQEAGVAYLRLGEDLILRKRIRVQSVVPIYAGLAEASIPGSEGRFDRNQYWRAKQQCFKALAVAKRYSLGIVWALRLLAQLYWVKGDYKSADRCWEEAILVAGRLKAPYEEALTLVHRGGVTNDTRLSEKGKELLHRCGAQLASENIGGTMSC